jgi:imidazole glycerol-phosphate synthase subunit HisH
MVQPYHVAIVDYRLGNLFSVKHACERAGIPSTITSSKKEILQASAVILPGVGAFGDAMDSLNQLDLVEPLRAVVASHRPLIGICLGMQLLMTESFEFGRHSGLGMIDGQVVRFEDPREGDVRLKVPHVGWNRIHSVASWTGTFLEGIADAEYMYFVHSYMVQPIEPSVVLSTSLYGQTTFCSTLRLDNLFGCQFHPERSGPAGLKIYYNLKKMLNPDDRH